MWRRLAVLAALIAVVVLFWYLDLADVDTLRGYWNDFLGSYQRNPVATLGIFALAYVLVTGAGLPGAAAFTLAAGALFGLGLGVVVASFASSIGAAIAVWVSRTLLGEWVQRRFGAQLSVVNQGVDKDGALYLLTLRLVPLFPFFVVNLLMGLTRMPIPRIYWVSQLGMLPGTAVYVYAGTQVADIEAKGILTPELIFALTLLGIFPWVARAFVRWLDARKVYRNYRRPKTFDANLLVIGGGSAGLIASLIGATVRAKTVLIERERMGGDCLNTGCVPSKTLIASAKVAHNMRKAASYGIAPHSPTVDFTAVMQRVRDVIAHIEPKDSMERYQTLGVECLKGDAHFIDPWTVRVGERVLRARSIVIASGAKPTLPPIPGLQEIDFLTSDNLWSLQALPERLLVLGAGPIGCELAQAFARLGSRVTLVDMLDRVLPKEDPDVSDFMRARLQDEGIDVLTGHGAERVQSGSMTLRRKGDESVVECAFDQLLVAVGRTPALGGMNLQAIGLEGRRLEVNEYLATRFPHIYACGDVVGPYQFTHMASHQAWYAAVNGLFGSFWRFRADYRVVPWATYTDPEVAQVGLNETMAKEQGVAYEAVLFPLSEVDRALADGRTDGWIKILTPPGKQRILGATIVGAHASELIAEIVLAMTHGLTLGKLLSTIHIYPTVMEGSKLAAGAWRRRHAPERLLHYVSYLHGWLRGA